MYEAQSDGVVLIRITKQTIVIFLSSSSFFDG